MKLQRINYAEAVIEAFFDGSDSNRPENRISPLTHYHMESSAPAAVYAEQSWCGAEIVMNGPAPAWFTMERNCDLPIAGFDKLRIFSAVPTSVRETIRALVDGQWQTLCENLPGTDTSVERDYPLTGCHLEKLSIRLEHDGTQDRGVLYKWIGLTDTAREQAMLALTSYYPPDWEDMLLPAGDFAPHIGICFDKDELEAIRHRVQAEPLKQIYENLKAEALSHLSAEPEKDIGAWIPHPDNRWARTRDMHKQGHHETMIVLAFVGLIEKNTDMMKMAVRMALSAAHCTHWTEGEVMGALNGSPWHHRSFTEEGFCRGCALVLDWAGGWITEHGKESIIDALVMKGLPRLESDFKRMEYIRTMNQGIVFSSGRIFGLLACAHFYPRYQSQLAEAERDLHEMIADYVLPDGGTPEGPTYWDYTFSHVMPILYALSRYHGTTFRQSLTPVLEKTGLHALAQLSITGNGASHLPVNDAGTYPYSPLLLSAYHKLTGKEDYAKLLALVMEGNNAGGMTAVNIIILSPDKIPAPEKYVQNGYFAMPDLGQARIIRPFRQADGNESRASLSFYTGMADMGHFHMDKGSFILETEEEALLIDRGTLPYSHPDIQTAQMPEYHNLLFPELSGTRPRQNPTRDGAYLVRSSYENGIFEAVGDITRCWNDSRILKSTRRIVSEDGNTYLFEDTMELSEAAPVSFLCGTLFPCEVMDNGVLVHGDHTTVRIEPVDWTAQVECVQFGVNGGLQPVWRICLRSSSTCSHHLRTRIAIE